MHVDIRECGDEIQLTLTQTVSRSDLPQEPSPCEPTSAILARLDGQMQEFLTAYGRIG